MCIYFVSCTSESGIPFTGGGLSNKLSDTGSERIIVGDATAEQCPAGGKIYTVYIDVNGNGIEDAAETPLSEQIVCNGQNGHDGTSGQDGVDGQDGENGQDGTDGRDGENAPASPYTIVAAIIPCASTAPYSEVLLRLQNGQVLVSFSEKSNGQNTRLAILNDGTFTTTDGNNCTFTLSTSADGFSRSISWNDQTQFSWPVLQ